MFNYTTPNFEGKAANKVRTDVQRFLKSSEAKGLQAFKVKLDTAHALNAINEAWKRGEIINGATGKAPNKAQLCEWVSEGGKAVKTAMFNRYVQAANLPDSALAEYIDAMLERYEGRELKLGIDALVNFFADKKETREVVQQLVVNEFWVKIYADGSFETSKDADPNKVQKTLSFLAKF